MEVDFAVLADAATIDASGKLNILGIFDRLTTSSFPARHARLCLVLRFSAGFGQAGRHAVRIELRGPDGREVLHIDGEMQLGIGTGGAVHVSHVLNMDGLVFPTPGSYSFDVRIDQEHKVSISLTVDRVPVGASA